MIEWNSDRTNFDRVGVFSTYSSGSNVRMWDGYGNHNKGFCVGFKTVEFCQQMKSGYGIVKYDDKPYLYRFLGVYFSTLIKLIHLFLSVNFNNLPFI